MNLPDSGFDKTLNQIKEKQQQRKRIVEKPIRDPVTKEESESTREAFRVAARYLLYGIDGKGRL